MRHRVTGKNTTLISSSPINIKSPTKPTISPSTWRKVVFCLKSKIAIINANKGEVPFKIESMPAESSWADQAKRKKGKAAFIIPSNIKAGTTLDIFTRSSLPINKGPNKRDANNSLIETK